MNAHETVNEFLFILKPAGPAGIGVFATQPIAKEQLLRFSLKIMLLENYIKKISIQNFSNTVLQKHLTYIFVLNVLIAWKLVGI